MQLLGFYDVLDTVVNAARAAKWLRPSCQLFRLTYSCLGRGLFRCVQENHRRRNVMSNIRMVPATGCWNPGESGSNGGPLRSAHENGLGEWGYLDREWEEGRAFLSGGAEGTQRWISGVAALGNSELSESAQHVKGRQSQEGRFPTVHSWPGPSDTESGVR